MLLRLFSVAMLASVTMPVAQAQAQHRPQVKVETGVAAGSIEDGVASWKGIPFAAPPVGPLRWRAPQPAANWQGVLDASSYKSDCMQKPFPSDAAPLGTPPAEDCLYANIWRPSAAPKGKLLPVIVWIYGGGFVNGGSSPPTYSGASLAKQGIVFVSFNYRVGRFGTFAHPQLTAEHADGAFSGNFGYLDQIAALKWVKRNVAAFGGDPDRVTIAGESAGGMSVHTLLTSPMAQGLFAGAVIMSGGDGSAMRKADLPTVEKIGVDFAEAKGIHADDPEALAKLRALSADDVTAGLSIMALFDPNNRPLPFSPPYVDGIVAVDAAKAYSEGKFAHVPIMVGATDSDIGGRTGVMVGGARRTAIAATAQGAPVYEYRFSYVAESIGKPGAQHATDIPYFFDTTQIKYGAATTPRDVGIGKQMSTYLANFAKSGNPNGPGLPSWERYAKDTDIIVDFSANGNSVPEKDPLGAELAAASGG